MPKKVMNGKKAYITSPASDWKRTTVPTQPRQVLRAAHLDQRTRLLWVDDDHIFPSTPEPTPLKWLRLSDAVVIAPTKCDEDTAIHHPM